jgi:hypothetical protein
MSWVRNIKSAAAIPPFSAHWSRKAWRVVSPKTYLPCAHQSLASPRPGLPLTDLISIEWGDLMRVE